MDDYCIFYCCGQISFVAFTHTATQEIEDDFRVVTSVLVFLSLLVLVVTSVLVTKEHGIETKFRPFLLDIVSMPLVCTMRPDLNECL